MNHLSPGCPGSERRLGCHSGRGGRGAVAVATSPAMQSQSGDVRVVQLGVVGRAGRARRRVAAPDSSSPAAARSDETAKGDPLAGKAL